jgi:hypothetical protein
MQIATVLDISVDELIGSLQTSTYTAEESDTKTISFSIEDKKTLTDSLFTIIRILDRYS